MAKTIEHKTVSITLLEENLVFYKIKENTVIELKDSVEMYEETLHLMQGKRYAALVDARATTSLTPEAREWSANDELHQQLIAQAIVVTSLANRLIGNFIIRFHKPKAPTRLFSSVEKAKEWLHEKIKESTATKEKRSVNALV